MSHIMIRRRTFLRGLLALPFAAGIWRWLETPKVKAVPDSILLFADIQVQRHSRAKGRVWLEVWDAALGEMVRTDYVEAKYLPASYEQPTWLRFVFRKPASVSESGIQLWFRQDGYAPMKVSVDASRTHHAPLDCKHEWVTAWNMGATRRFYCEDCFKLVTEEPVERTSR